MKLVRVISLVLQKRCFSKNGFKMSAQAKKNLPTMFVMIFQVSADEEMGK